MVQLNDTSEFTGGLRHVDKPWTLNGERKLHHFERAELVKEWRYAFRILARDAKWPLLKLVHIEAEPHLRRLNQDTAGCFPAVKAAIDGLVDARVLPNDGPGVVRSLTFLAPVKAEKDALVLRVRGEVL